MVGGMVTAEFLPHDVIGLCRRLSRPVLYQNGESKKSRKQRHTIVNAANYMCQWVPGIFLQCECYCF